MALAVIAREGDSGARPRLILELAVQPFACQVVHELFRQFDRDGRPACEFACEAHCFVHQSIRLDETRPHWCAVAASTSSPVSIISIARPRADQLCEVVIRARVGGASSI